MLAGSCPGCGRWTVQLRPPWCCPIVILCDIPATISARSCKTGSGEKRRAMESNVKGESEMSWLYDQNSGKPKDEDYLLGKAVDSNVEARGTEGQINAVEYDCTPESIFASQAEHQVDLQRKLQEDPLISLRMREVDTRKKILDNPLKMREIRRYIESMKKKKKRKKKSKKKVDESDDEEKDLDAKLLQRLKRKVFQDDDKAWVPKDQLEGRRGSPLSKRDHQDDGRRRHRRRADSSSDSDGERSRGRRRRRRRRGSSSSSSSRNVSRERRCGDHGEGSSRTFGSRGRKASSSSMSREDKERKLREMMDNARWREDNRSRNVKRYRRDEKAEELELEKQRQLHHNNDDDDSSSNSFVKNQLLRAAADAGSVEKRLRANRHNIQRGVSAMSENFAKR